MVNLFLTDSDYRKSAKNLDDKRLGKQRVEAFQILTLLQDLNFLAQYYKKERPSQSILLQTMDSRCG